MVKESDTPTPVQLEMELGCIATLSSLEDNDSTASLQNGGRVFEWFTSEDTSCMNASINFLNVDNISLCNESNACGIISVPVINRTIGNNYTHILYGPLKRCIYRCMISKSTVPEAEIQIVM